MDQSSVRFMIRIGCYLLILIATITAALIVFLSQIDLNDYRHSLERQLTSTFKQPVRIGHSSLTFSHGLALALEDLQIGSDRATLADIPHITATLKIAPLFTGHFILDQVQIDNPSFKLWLPFPERPSKGTSQQLISSLGITTLNVHNANIIIYQKQGNEFTQQLVLSDLHAVLQGWNPGEVGQLVISGQLQEQGTEFLLDTRLPSSQNPEIWRKEEFNSNLKIRNFPARKFLKTAYQYLPESLELNLSLQGTPVTGVTFNATLSNSDKHQQLGSLSGRWISSDNQESITKLQGDLLSVPLRGEFHLLRKAEKLFLAGRLGAKDIALTQKLLQTLSIPNSDKFIGGQLDQLMFSINQSWDTANSLTTIPDMNLNLAVSNLNWDLPEFKQLQDLAVHLSLKNHTLNIEKGTLVGANHSFFFSGKIDSLFRQPQLEFELNFSSQLTDFAKYINLPKDWEISGSIPGALNLSGSLFDPTYILQADLSSIKANMGLLFQKKLTDNGSIFLRGHLGTKQFYLDKCTFNLNDFNVSAKGYFQPGNQEQKYHFKTSPSALDKLQPFSPLLKRIKLTGTAVAEISPHNDAMQATVKVDNGGAHIISFLGDIKKTSGTIRLDQHGFTFKKLNTSLGESPFIVDGIFTNWHNPLLVLDINGKKVRAEDIVFSNRHLTFYDLTGQLQIDADSIRFTPVKVRLEDDTAATVNGEVKFSDPIVDFDISAERADVLDIINLFVDKDNKVATTTDHEGAPLHIKFSAKQGNIGGLKFENAVGLITGEGEQLTVYPLKFENGTGWCNARIEFSYDDDIAPLKVSGHAEDIDASTIHQNVFEKRGLVSGLLKGDFYIEGNPSRDQFWHNANGGIHLQIKEGALRKFHGLAKVFSLLNVSQIFDGKLPDMNREGMPFTLVDGSVKIGEGQAKIDDLKITSVAMNLSVVGTHDLTNDTMNFTLGVMPLRTVDKIISVIPLAGWILTGEDKALITAHFKIEGNSENPRVTAIPISSVSKTVFGIFKRTFGLPGKVIDMFKTQPAQKTKE